MSHRTFEAPYLLPLFSRIQVDMDYRRAGIAVAISHVLRSFLQSDNSDQLTLEIHLFRAEISRAENTLQKTSVILEHCNSYSGFLVYLLKLLAFSELVLLAWIGYLIFWRLRVVQTTPALGDQPDNTQLQESPDSLHQVTLPPSSPPREGPTRPSDLKKKSC